ncbi:serine hydrolase domain-containing protein [Muricoccus radiodurans]|uniref:serine hydrolase domain-containing protein n=1 Tax=Muricoccus radiodurans TaxID=2231721 RepID=UPI003CEEBFD5
MSGATPSAFPLSAEAGFAPALELARGLGTKALLILHHGRVAATLGDPAWRANVRSIRKSILAALIGIAVEKGQLDLGATLEALGIDDHEGLSPVERDATVYDLLTARSGIMHPAGYESARMKLIKPPRHAHAPGTWWTYNNWDFNALGTIYERAAGRSVPDAFAALLAGPLGMEDFVPEDATHIHAAESRHPAYPIRLSSRDLARFGQLWMAEGRWEGRQIVPAHWVRCSVQPISDAGQDGAYGYMWWVCRGGVHLPGVILPEDAHSARGWGGHLLLVVPSLGLIVVHRAQTETEPFRTVDKFAMGRIIRSVLEALR